MIGNKDKPYSKLRNLMSHIGLTQDYIGRNILNYKSNKSISERFNKKKDFSIQEAYMILNKCGKAAEDIVDFFPPDFEFSCK